ncbi:antA/AntB antirepressor family protein [Mesorhizobium sp. AR10]|nr:antA/AntB antirepressor family protein [Mesorhizobium sp. AR10]
MKDRIDQYGFAENVDYVLFPEIGEQVFQWVRPG